MRFSKKVENHGHGLALYWASVQLGPSSQERTGRLGHPRRWPPASRTLGVNMGWVVNLIGATLRRMLLPAWLFTVGLGVPKDVPGTAVEVMG